MIYKVLNETKITDIDEKYKVDITDDVQRGGHRARLKITGIKSKGKGTSVPIYSESPKTYDDVDNLGGIRIEESTKSFLPILKGFVCLNHSELLKYIEGSEMNPKDRDSIKDSLKLKFDSYFRINKGKSDNYIRIEVDRKLRK